MSRTERGSFDGLPADLGGVIHELEDMVGQARPVPLSASVMLNRAELDELVAELRAALPAEVRQARWILRERAKVLDKARQEADELLAEAHAQRKRLLSRTEIVRAADREAHRIVGEARQEARRARQEAEDYVDTKLANFEVVLQKLLTAVQRGRERMHRRLDTNNGLPVMDSGGDGPRHDASSSRKRQLASSQKARGGG